MLHRLAPWVAVFIGALLSCRPADTGPTLVDETEAVSAGRPLHQGSPQTPRVKQTPSGIDTVVVPAIVTEIVGSFEPAPREASQLRSYETPTPARPNPRPGRGVPVSLAADVTADRFSPLPAPEPLASETSFESTDFDDNGAETGFVFIPPDSHAAAGPDHVVNVTNVLYTVHSKSGTQLARGSMGDFFAALAPLTETFDPKILYDQFAGRWVMVTLEQTDFEAGDPFDTSRILVAVSDDSNPLGTWFIAAIDSLTMINGQATWADYPGVAVDEEAVYITNNMFCFRDLSPPVTCDGEFQGTRLWIIDKGMVGGFYAGASVDVSVVDPYIGLPAFASTSQPAHVYGTPPAGSVGTYLTRYGGLTNMTDEAVVIVTVDDPLGTPAFSYDVVNFGNVETSFLALPDAPQSGTTDLIEVNDRRTLNAVWQGDRLYVTTTVLPDSLGGPDADDTTAMLLEIDTSSTPSFVARTLFGSEDIATGTYTSFPSVAVNPSGDVAVGFSASAGSIFPGAYYDFRPSGGSFEGSGTVHAGEDFYLRTFGGASNRWGDYSATAVDPVDGCFWFYNQYAMARGSGTAPEDGRWSTAYLQICSDIFADGFESGNTSAWSIKSP